MRFTFNLVDEPWVPCIDANGRARELGLQEALVRAHELRELGGESPLVTAALHRLLLAVLHRVFGPAGRDEWHSLWKARRFPQGQIGDYLARWKHRFDLFDAERPFCQVNDPRVKQKPVVSLLQDVASGNNATLFDHHTEVGGMVLSPAQSARALLASQAFALGGGKSGIPQNYTDAPWARGVVFIVEGKTLFETLMLNLIRYTTEPANGTPLTDNPCWEMHDPFNNTLGIPAGLLEQMTWHSRRILLIPEQAPDKSTVVREMKFTQGFALDSSILDPMKHYTIDRDKKRPPRPLPFREDRALWRDSTALFQLDKTSYRPPAAFYWLAELVEVGYLDTSETKRHLALGMATTPGQAKVDFFRGEEMPLPLRYLAEQALVERLDEALRMTEDVRNQLWGAARTLATYLLSPQADASEGRKPSPEDLNSLTGQWAVERDYWSRLEIPFRQLVEELPNGPEPALEGWCATLRRTAWNAFDGVARDVGAGPRGLKAEVRAREQLAAGLAKALPENG